MTENIENIARRVRELSKAPWVMMEDARPLAEAVERMVVALRNAALSDQEGSLVALTALHELGIPLTEAAMTETEICPHCEGAGEVGALLRYESGCRPGVVRCFTCGGMGFIDATHAAAIRDGKRRSQERQAEDLSLREKAAQMGISPVELSDLEHAKAWRPNYTLEQVAAARRHAGRRPLSIMENGDE